jgi:hypothetical protein
MSTASNDNHANTYNASAQPAALIGQTFHTVRRWDNDPTDTISFYSETATFHLYHAQECCENVFISDICGELSDLQGSPIVRCEIRSSDGESPNGPIEYGHYDETALCGTWTFIEIATNKGSVTIRFFGASNGYYSETAEFFIEELA